jgi:signal transduction histidine kinase
MSENTKVEQSPGLASWEVRINRYLVWIPYAALALSAGGGLIWGDSGDRLAIAVLSLAAAVWTWLTLSRLGPPHQVSQVMLRVYFVGFVVLGFLLMAKTPLFLVYGISGFFIAFLLRPMWVALVGIGAAGFIVHSHVVFLDQRASAWAIYFGIVAVQTASVAAGLYGAQKLAEIAEERRRALAQVEETMAENAGLHAQLVAQAREAGVLDERQRMAREIHDTIAQGLTGVITQLEAAHQALGDDGEVTRHLDLAGGIARESLDEARRSVQAIRPGPLDHSRLPEALDEIAAKWAAASDIDVQMQTTGERRPLHPDVEVTLLRAAQEALANVAKHSSATRVGITLSFMDGAVVLDVRDDGIGFEPEGPVGESSFGLAGMRQRVEDAKGRMEIESAPGEGTAISITLTTEVQPHGR